MVKQLHANATVIHERFEMVRTYEGQGWEILADCYTPDGRYVVCVSHESRLLYYSHEQRYPTAEDAIAAGRQWLRQAVRR